MGTGGSTVGDATPGSRSPVQKTLVGQPDRDWRYSGYVLPVQLLQFNAATQSNNVYLTWSIITAQSLRSFQIERSTDNRTFINISSQTADIPLNIAQGFSVHDDISNVNSQVVFYRLKIIAANGQVKYSNVLLVRKDDSDKTKVTIRPNPATNYAAVLFYSSKENIATVRLIDNIGKTVMVQKSKVFKGNNNLQLVGLSKYSDGAYSLQVILQDEIIVQKLIISNR